MNVAIATGRGKMEVVHFLLGSDLSDRYKHVRKQAVHQNKGRGIFAVSVPENSSTYRFTDQL